MAKLSNSAVEVYQEHMDVLRKLSSNLTSQRWFSSSPWFISKGIYARGIGLQMAKTHWYNHEGQGIHLETWIDEDAMSRREVAVVMHVEPHVPNRAKFNETFWSLAKSKIERWEGYEIKEGNLMELWRKSVPFVKSKAASTLTEEFLRIKDLGEDIDTALSKL